MTPAISVIVEWDNPHLYSGNALEQRSLTRLAEELSTIGRTAEVIVVFNDRHEKDVVAVTALCLKSPILVPVRGQRYYDMKDAGFAMARGELIVLWDSDIEPVPGALRRLVDAFDDPSRLVVAGCPFIDPSSLMGRAWSVLSVFPPRSNDDAIERVPRFFANLVAFRREVIERYRFGGNQRMRMQCVALSERLATDGIAIWRARGARVKHPPPEGMRGLVQRAVWHAHDIIDTHAERGRPRALAAVRAFASVAAMSVRRARKLGTQRRDLGIALHESGVIAVVIVAFGVLELLLLPVAAIHPRVPRWAA